MYEKPVKAPSRSSSSAFLSQLYAYCGPHLAGTRNWLLFTILVLLVIVLLGGFAYAPLAAILAASSMAAFFGTLILTLKIAAFIGFILSLTMGIKAMVDDYYQHEAGDRNYFWWPYLKELYHKNFVLSDKRTANLIKLAIGLLLFALVTTLLACTAGIGLTVPIVGVIVHFTATAFATTGIFAGSAWFAAIFLGVLVMTAYDILCTVIESFLPYFSIENPQTKTSNDDSGLLKVADNQEEVSDENSNNDIFSNPLSSLPNEATQQLTSEKLRQSGKDPKNGL